MGEGICAGGVLFGVEKLPFCCKEARWDRGRTVDVEAVDEEDFEVVDGGQFQGRDATLSFGSVCLPVGFWILRSKAAFSFVAVLLRSAWRDAGIGSQSGNIHVLYSLPWLRAT